MLNKLYIGNKEQKLIIYTILIMLTLAVFWQVLYFDFVSLDDPTYVIKNSHIKSGISLEGIRWAFSTTYAEFWHPLTWLSLMLDYQLYGLNPGGYHITNLILHILSMLLLFWLFCRMTGSIWKSAFVAALFSLHPMHVESVARIASRKDVLSAFFWMLTLCLYVYYAEKPVLKRYSLVLFSFVCGLMSKSMVVTIPVVMILLDYWPLKRFESKKENLFLWQLKEKFLFLVLCAFFSIITIYAQHKYFNPYFQSSLSSRFANAIVSFITYLEKTFWPNDLIVCYDFFNQLSLWQIIGDSLLIFFISIGIILGAKRLPSLFVGWLWYSITILPVIGIIPRGFNNMADHYTYLPLTGIFIILAWVTPDLIKSGRIRKYILLPAAILSIFISAFLSWQQCGYWKNSKELYRHAINVESDNYRANYGFGLALLKEGNSEEAIYYFNKSISKSPNFAYAYNSRGNAYIRLGLHQRALDDFNKAIHLKPDLEIAYNNKSNVYYELGRYQQAIENYSKAIQFKPDYVEAYLNRARAYYKLGNYELAVEDYNEAMRLNNNYMPAE